MSTFSGLGTATSALAAARRGMDVVGQNIANQKTVGYTRQRLETSALGPDAITGRFSGGVTPGRGVSVDGITRLGDAVLDGRVRDTLGASGFWSTRAAASATAEAALAEPTENGLADHLSRFWAAWQDVANTPDSTAAAAVVLTGAEALTARLADGYRAVAQQWSDGRASAERTVAQINATATEIAGLNEAIRTAAVSGLPANELVDQRNLLVQTVSRLSGAVGTLEADGTMTVRVDGNALVAGGTVRPLALGGATDLSSDAPATVVWADQPDRDARVTSGELGGLVAVLAPAADGGTLAGLAASYNTVATAIATAVNTQHRLGVTADGTPGGDFFTFAAGTPAALGLQVAVTGRAELAVAAPGGGTLDGSNADALAAIGARTDGPDAVWADVVSRFAVATAADAGGAGRAEAATVAAVAAQQSVAGVSTDEETVALLTYQTAYQAAARVITAVDEALDVLINRTGVVGR